MAWDRDFEVAFNPRVIAVVGASRRTSRRPDGDYIGRLQKSGFDGHIYPVNPNAAEIRGLTCYPTVAKIPEAIDLVIISIPAREVPGVLEDCITVGAKNIFIFTAGFEETGEEEGIELGARIKEIAHRGRLRIIGPNGMGLCVPANKISTIGEVPAESGPVAFLSQSGGHASEYMGYAQEFGLRFSKVISFGNALTLESTDYLEYLATDPETEIICMYLEGVRDGRRFAKLVREVNPTKPIIIWKGGLTELGARTVSSHTGSLAGQEAIWNAFFQQTGAVRVNSLEEMADVTMTFLYLRPLQGRRAAVIAGGGGISVAAADDCARAGLEVPVLTTETRKQLRSFIRPAGMIIRNPLDLWEVMGNIAPLKQALELAAADPLIDMLILMQSFNMGQRRGRGQRRGAAGGREMGEFLVKFARENTHQKPMVVVSRVRGWGMRATSEVPEIRAELMRSGVPVYRTLARASLALSRFIRYHEFQREAQA